jgi:hypothetical protein
MGVISGDDYWEIGLNAKSSQSHPCASLSLACCDAESFPENLQSEQHRFHTVKQSCPQGKETKTIVVEEVLYCLIGLFLWNFSHDDPLFCRTKHC